MLRVDVQAAQVGTDRLTQGAGPARLTGAPNRRALRPLGDVVYLMPPYILTPEEVTLMTQTAIGGIEQAVRD